jgi:hypothetical protein
MNYEYVDHSEDDFDGKYPDKFVLNLGDLEDLIAFGDLTGEIEESVMLLQRSDNPDDTLICLNAEQVNAIVDYVSALREELRDTGIIAWGPSPEIEP